MVSEKHGKWHCWKFTYFRLERASRDLKLRLDFRTKVRRSVRDSIQDWVPKLEIRLQWYVNKLYKRILHFLHWIHNFTKTDYLINQLYKATTNIEIPKPTKNLNNQSPQQDCPINHQIKTLTLKFESKSCYQTQCLLCQPPNYSII